MGNVWENFCFISVAISSPLKLTTQVLSHISVIHLRNSTSPSVRRDELSKIKICRS